MKVKIKRVDKNLPLPQYHTDGAVGFDLFARLDIDVLPKEVKLIPMNNVIQVPQGHVLFLLSRSSTPIKKGLMIANSVGVIDQDFDGDTDELLAEVYNFTDQIVTIKKGERIAQGIVMQVARVSFSEVGSMHKESGHSGFGSTG